MSCGLNDIALLRRPGNNVLWSLGTEPLKLNKENLLISTSRIGLTILDIVRSMSSPIRKYAKFSRYILTRIWDFYCSRQNFKTVYVTFPRVNSIFWLLSIAFDTANKRFHLIWRKNLNFFFDKRLGWIKNGLDLKSTEEATTTTSQSRLLLKMHWSQSRHTKYFFSKHAWMKEEG